MSCNTEIIRVPLRRITDTQFESPIPFSAVVEVYGVLGQVKSKKSYIPQGTRVIVFSCPYPVGDPNAPCPEADIIQYIETCSSSCNTCS